MVERISVIICAYNYAQFLPKCLETVFSQTRPPDEIIVLDDGSTDETAEVVRRFQGVRYIRQEHAGKAVAFNRGVQVSSGDIICHLDADDYWFERKLERLVDTLRSFPKAGGMVHDAVIIHGDEAPPTDIPSQGPPALLSLEDSLLGFVYLPRKYRRVRGYFYGRWAVTPFAGGISVRRQAIEPYMPFPTDIGLSVDGLLWYVASTSTLIHLPEVLGVYRHHGRNYWVNNPHALEGQIRLYRWLMNSPSFSKHLSRKQRRLLSAKLAEDALRYELMGGPRLDRRPRLALAVLLLTAGVLPGWKHWLMGMGFPAVKFARRLIHHIKGYS